MGIIVNLDVMLAKRKMKLQDLADRMVLRFKTYRSSKQAK
ncbi:putative transcriptional regulator [Holospora undulata HU1]|uniref:Putative transcriptional regulator n=1 Tax=Holospora undulata HU1 TaxID=1321371 RepID=A0A061JFZ7_9PROT|nr:putative transcriptional regulator [Holospora undulata HU1]